MHEQVMMTARPILSEQSHPPPPAQRRPDCTCAFAVDPILIGGQFLYSRIFLQPCLRSDRFGQTPGNRHEEHAP